MARSGWVALAAGVLIALTGACGGDDDGTAATTASTTADAPPATAEGGEVRYLAIGDSLSQGVGAADETTGAFPIVLAEEWRDDGCEVEVRNAGISGYTAGQMLAEQVPIIDEVDPTVITFQSGANDIANGIDVDQYRSDIGAVLDAATGSGARVLVLVQNEWFRAPAAPDYGDPALFEEQREEYDAVMVEEAEARGAELVDLREIYAQNADDGLWVDDGIHPTEDVYAEWAAAIADAVPAPCE